MKKAQKLQHEDFLIEGEKRLHFVRQDRHETKTGEYFLEYNNKKYPILDYSYFGISFESDVDIDQEKKLDKVIFSNANKTFGEFHATVKRSEKRGGKYKIALELNEGFLPVDSLIADQEAQDILDDHSQYRQFIGDIPVELKSAVYEIKDVITNLKDKIDNLEKNKMFYSEDDMKAFEESVSCKIQSYLSEYFDPFYDQLVAFSQKIPKDAQEKMYQFFRDQLKPILYLSPFAHRSYYKPSGYAGDYEMMNILYNDEAVGTSLFAKGINKYFVNHPNAKAVRNRSQYLYRFLTNHIEKNPGKTLSFLSVASGPAKEIQLILSQLPVELCNTLEINLLDQDLNSLKFAQKEINRIIRERNLKTKVNYLNQSIKNVIIEGLSGSYDVVYSAGLFDYFSDDVAREAAMRMYAAVKSGGELNIGNFCLQPSSAALMMYTLDWYLIYRSEERLTNIYSPICSQLRIDSEEMGVNLFVVFQKD